MRFSNVFKRAQGKPSIRETRELSSLRGPLTAREALTAILPQVREADPEFKLTFVGSGEGINHEGRAYAWDFFFESVRSQQMGDFTVRLFPREGDDEGPWCMDMRVRPIRDSATRSLKLTPRPPRPALPVDFRDSPEAVRALAEQGADWISGDTHMTLSSKVRPDGAVVWHTFCWDQEYQTPFANLDSDGP